MFIELEDDLFDGIEKINDAYDERIQAIDHLFEAMNSGKHIVYAKYSNLQKVYRQETFGKRTREYVKWISDKYVQIYSCRDMVDGLITLSYKYDSVKRIERGDKTVFCLPIDMCVNITETKLLTEDDADGIFYIQMAKYVLSQKIGNSIFSLCLENDSYYGSHSEPKIDLIVKSRKIALCICDTDKDYPEDSIGGTCKNVRKAFNKAKKEIAIDLLELPVREKENLFTAEVYSFFSDKKLVHVLAEKYSENRVISDFFDIKEGVKYKRILNRSEMWDHFYRDIVKTCEERGFCDLSLTERDGEEKYIDGIGSKLCDVVADVLFAKNKTKLKTALSFSNAKVDETFNSIDRILSRIPEYVYKYWETICKKMFTWGCCLNDVAFPATRTR